MSEANEAATVHGTAKALDVRLNRGGDARM